MDGPRQLVFPQIAPGRDGAPEGDNHAPRAAQAIRGPSRRAGGGPAAVPPGLKGSEVERLKGAGGERLKCSEVEKGKGAGPFNLSTVQPFNPPPRPRLVAAVFAEEDDGHGNLRLRKVTTTRWLTVRQIAEILRVSVQTVYSRIDAEELPAYRIGNAIRVSADDFEAYLKISRYGGAEELRALASLLE